MASPGTSCEPSSWRARPLAPPLKSAYGRACPSGGIFRPACRRLLVVRTPTGTQDDACCIANDVYSFS